MPPTRSDVMQALQDLAAAQARYIALLSGQCQPATDHPPPASAPKPPPSRAAARMTIRRAVL
jgi:hypothetical protein